MSKKIFKLTPIGAAVGALSGKKKKAETVAPVVPGQAVTAPLSAEEAKRRKLLPKAAPLGLNTSILGNLSGTLGG